MNQKAILIAIIAVVAVLVLWLVIRKKVEKFRARGRNVFRDYLYFDNNGTTRPHKEVVRAMYEAAYLGNASPDYAQAAKSEIEEFKRRMNVHLSSQPCCSNYQVVITSGASESNNLIIRGLVDRYWLDLRRNNPTATGPLPHIILSSIEHKTSIKAVEDLIAEGRCTATFVASNIEAMIDPKSVHEAIQPTTILISIMHANNETGTINPIDRIGQIAKDRDIPFHTDVVQTIGKHPINMELMNVSALSMSMHKMYGPQGLGALVMRRDLADLLVPQITGSQNDGLRGGTENIMAIAGANTAMKITWRDRVRKNEHLRSMKERVVKKLINFLTVLPYREFAGKPDEFIYPGNKLSVRSKNILNKYAIVFLGPTTGKGLPIELNGSGYVEHASTTSGVMPHTLQFSIIKLPESGENAVNYKNFCNIKLRRYLLKNKTIVSIGSACNATSKDASHVLKAIKAPFIIRCGVIRVSFGDYNNIRQCDRLVNLIMEAIKNQY